MDASTVMEITKLLPEEELVRLYCLLETKLSTLDVLPKPKSINKKQKKRMPVFTEQDAQDFLFKNLKI
ncbi:hypothetical protein DU428_00585 [Oceanihabitans sediminis]|uniref:Uncharacterized protein n=1 Tax=Oceanihabitans sediminis TaxID=1812012 RepID=A0A368P742_9FLAO|nr:hypothetical protein DU428_00585 [Oceanihabitans sediminis]